MAVIPNLENVLLEMHQSLGLKRPQSKYIDQFSGWEMQIGRHMTMRTELMEDIFSSLDLDAQARRDATFNVAEFFGFYRELEKNLWTARASEKQVIWHMLAYVFVPGLARRIAFWNLAGIEHGQPIDAGMPGGEFWFLPDWDQENDEIKLPVAQVLDWLIDLIAGSSLEQAFEGLTYELDGKTINGHALRTLQGWRHDGITPKSASQIDAIFTNEAILEFYGVLELAESLDLEQQFQDALAFIQSKGLDSKALSSQIPMKAEWLGNIIHGTPTDEDKKALVHNLAVRYAKPSMQTIRQRLKVARLTQDGYKRLVKLICDEGVEPTSADPSRNKLLQLIALFHSVHNLTIQAWKNGGTTDEQDTWFDTKLAPWDREDLLLSIAPSQWSKNFPAKLGERLTRKFSKLAPDSPIQDLVPMPENHASEVIRRRVEDLKQAHDEIERTIRLKDRALHSSPWRALQGENNYEVISRLGQDRNLPERTRIMVFERLSELAKTPEERIRPLFLKLFMLLDEKGSSRSKNLEKQVQALLDSISSEPDIDGVWAASLMQCNARHRLNQNDLEGACEDFNNAFKACKKRNYGELQASVASKGFAAELIRSGLKAPIQKEYFMTLLQYGAFPEDVKSLEDAAVYCEDYFWKTLYQPYSDIPRMKVAGEQEFKTFLDKLFTLVRNDQWEELRTWLQTQSRKFRKITSKDVRHDSILLRLIKTLGQYEQLFAGHAVIAKTAVEQLTPMLEDIRRAVGIIVEEWPEQVSIMDFKGQTPLMLAADAGDVALTNVLMPASAIDTQDYLGRTALHAAVAGGSSDCVARILDANPDVNKVTIDEGNTVLHTAVRFGSQKNIQLIVEEFPGLLGKKNKSDQTPLAMAKDILANYDNWKQFMKTNNRQIGSKADYEAIIEMLTAQDN